ncbi:glycine betaine ABC transporter substrate-binding protein [Eubacteriaceae bacterium ES3]|nr:glycine betaine ABC transporter substrate-binding protein [Eubacteriaceae bacterium ES3]
MKRLTVLLMTFVMVFAMAACAPQEESKIVIGEGDWDSNAFHDQIVKIIVEEGYGVGTEIVVADTAVEVSGLTTGDMDVVVEMWSDNIPSYEQDLADGNYVELGINFDDDYQGLYVPTYMVEGPDAIAPDLKTVEDLKKYPELFPDPEGGDLGIIYGGPEGWEVTAFMQRKMEAYGLDEFYTFRSIDSTAALTATLSGAYERGEPWVGYYWEPTWIMGLYDMTLLGDTEYSPEGYEVGEGGFAAVTVTVVVTSDFEERYPEITEFLSNYSTSSAITSEGLAYMQENEVEAAEAAKWFISQNPDLIEGMVTADAFEKIMAYVES